MGEGSVAGGRGIAELGRGEGGRGWGDEGEGKGGLGKETPPLTERVLSHCRCSWCLLQHAPEEKGEERHVMEVEREVRGEVMMSAPQEMGNGLLLCVAGSQRQRKRPSL